MGNRWSPESIEKMYEKLRIDLESTPKETRPKSEIRKLSLRHPARVVSSISISRS